MDYATVKIDTETACGQPIEGWTVRFRVTWTHDDDHGPEVECDFYRAHLGHFEINRKTAVAIFGEERVREMEERATTHMAERMPDYLEAAE